MFSISFLVYSSLNGNVFDFLKVIEGGHMYMYYFYFVRDPCIERQKTMKAMSFLIII